LEIATQLRATVYLLVGLPCAAVMLKRNRQPERAVETLALAFAHPKSLTGWLECWPLITQLRADLELDLGAETFDATWERGTQLDAEEIAHDLLRELSTAEGSLAEPATPSLFDPLSRRELEVLALIANGLTNQEIAAQLYIGVSTVKKHINHIFSKLDVKNRTQAANRARELTLLD
jgi:ATP/maltotriose-dependent transcriptional regulator MalT